MKIVQTNLNIIGLTNRTTTRRIILHHVAGTATVQGIHDQHARQGWGGIGYHYFIDKDGTIYMGRAETAIGIHATNNNQDSIGICFNGNFETDTMSMAQMSAGKELVAHLRQKYNIAISSVVRHKDVNATACPGKNFLYGEIISTASAINTELEKKEEKKGDFTNMKRAEIEVIIGDMYFSLMERKADAGGLKYWSDKAQAGMSFIDIYKAMSGSREMVTKFVTDILYKGLLKRSPDTKGLKYYVDGILNGTLTKETAHNAIVNSAEHKKLKK